MNGRIVAIRDARLMDSLKLSKWFVSGVNISLLDLVISRVTLRFAVVEFRSAMVQPKVPLMLSPGEMAIMGHTIPALKVEPRIG